MTYKICKYLLAGTAFIAAPSWAQETSQALPAASAANGEIGADEILVTARRKDERLRDVPATVSVLTAKALELTGAKTAADFIQLTSGVSISTGTTTPSDTSVNIRGLNGARDAENNVAVVVDGILKTNSAATNKPQGALSQVEILKGPQGAIYGRNASAGAIVITTQKPGDHLAGTLRASAGNDNTYSVNGLISGPITDTVGFSLNGEWAKSDGYYRNTFLASPLNQTLYPGNSTDSSSVDYYQKLNLFGRVLITPSSDTEIDLKAEYGRMRAGAVSFNAILQLPPLVTAFGSSLFNERVNDHEFVFTNNIKSRTWEDTYGASVRLSQTLGSTKLIASAAYNNINDEYIAGGTSGAFGFFDNEPHCIATRAATAGNVINQEPFTTFNAAFGFAQPYAPNTCDGIQGDKRAQKDVVTELRLVSTAGGPFQWQVGGSYIYIDRRVYTNLNLDTGNGGIRGAFNTDPRFATEALQDDSYQTNVYALFGSADYAASEKLKLGLALRYDIEARNTENNVPVLARTRWVGNPLTGHPNGTATTPANYFLNPGLDPAYNPSGILAPRSATFKQLQPKLSLSYKLNSETNLFASWGIGFKAGGFNAGGTRAIVTGFFNAPVLAGGLGTNIGVEDQYKKETTSAYEAGVKGRAFGDLDYELVGYYTDVKNMQFFEFFVGNFGFLRSVSNIDKVRIYGVEGSLNYRIISGWSVFAAANYTKSRIVKNSSRPYTVGNKSPTTPDYTLNFGTQVDEPLTGSLRLIGRADVRVTGPTPFHTVQDNTGPTIFGLAANYKNSIRATYTIANARLGVETDRWSLAAFATNLFNTRYVEDVVIAPEFGGDFVAAGKQRRFGVEGSAKF